MNPTLTWSSLFSHSNITLPKKPNNSKSIKQWNKYKICSSRRKENPALSAVKMAMVWVTIITPYVLKFPILANHWQGSSEDRWHPECYHSEQSWTGKRQTLELGYHHDILTLFLESSILTICQSSSCPRSFIYASIY